MNFRKRLFSLLLAMTMMVTYMPSFAFAEDGQEGNPSVPAQTQVEDEDKDNTAATEPEQPKTETKTEKSTKAAGGPLRAGGSYTATYEYSGSDLPSAVTATLPIDDNTYEDGATVTAKQPSETEVEDGDDTYTFDGWDADQKTINGSNITFTGTWTKEDGGDAPGGDEDEYEDEGSYPPNPPQPDSYADDGLVTITSTSQIGSSGTHIANLDKGFGKGVCCYHARHYAKANSKGYVRELTSSDPHYEQIKRAMYWGFERGDGATHLGHAFSIHIMLSYWMNGNSSLTSGIKEGTSRFASAKKYCKKLYDKGAVPDNFHVYEWVGIGGAASKQTMITYKIINGGYVKLVKQPANTNTNFLQEAPNNYALDGAVYELYTNQACTERAYDIDYNYFTFTTDANGNTTAVEVEAGKTYWAKEITASKGFKLDTNKPSASVTTNNTAANPAVINSTEPPVYEPFEFKFRKIDTSGNHGYKDLLGTEFTISYYDVDMGYGSTAPTEATLEGKSPARTWTYKAVKKTDSDGEPYAGFDTKEDSPESGSSPFYTEGDKNVLPRGVFTVEETKAAPGMAKNDTVYYCRVYQASNGSAAGLYIDSALGSTSSGAQLIYKFKDDEQHPVLEIQKKDAETGEASAQGRDRDNVAGSLAGAVYSVYYDDPAHDKPQKVGEIVTDENGYGKLEKRTEGDENHIGDWLPLGKYYIEEDTASPGYTVDAMYYENKEDEYKNGQHIVVARAQGGNTETFTYTVESKEQPHHTYISKREIGEDGKPGSEELPGATLQLFDSEGNLIEEWVSGTEPHDIVALHDETQGLKDGKYILREITAPYGYDVAEDMEFTVSSGAIENRVVMVNKPLEIGTIAKDGDTNSHQGVLSEDAVINDTVKLSGLYEGRTYQVRGVLYDKKTGDFLKDADGNEVTAETEPFVATGDTMEVEVKFSVDTSKFDKDQAVVAFETLFRTEPVDVPEGHPEWPEEDLPVELAKHEDPKDPDQTINYGGIVGTVATDENQINHNVLGGPNAVIVDTVEYKNLSTKETYTIEGELFDKTTNQSTGVKVSVKFTPKTESGTTQIKFTLDSTALKNHDLVAFEGLYLNGTLIDEHKDPNDPKQTVHVPEIGTKAGKPSKKTVKDTVAYKGLIPGQTYVMKGWLVNKKTGRKIKGSDGSVTFTPSEPNGYVVVTLKLKGFKGTAVAYEECYMTGTVDGKQKETKVGEHKNIKDKAQTITVKGGKKGTKSPDTGDNLPLLPLVGFAGSLAALLAMIIRRLKMNK